jgi:hypothetical protein
MDDQYSSTPEHDNQAKIPVVYSEHGRAYNERVKQKAEDKNKAVATARARSCCTAAPYPVDALGPVLRRAAWAIWQKVQCPPVMAANSVPGVASLAAQAKADVQLPTGQAKPLSLFIATIAESGDRKTATDTEAMKAVKAREFDLSKAYAERLSAYKRKRAAWRSEYDRILKSKEPLETKESQLRDLGDEPIAPRIPNLTLQEATQEGIIKGFLTMPPGIGIFSSEGATFLTGHGFTPEKKTTSGGAFSSHWDGGEISRGRAGDGLIFMSGKRLAAHVMIQPEIANEFLSDSALRNQGFLARFLVAQPESLAGTRMWKDAPLECHLLLAHYLNAVLWLFEAGKAKDEAGAELDLIILTMSPEARASWIAFSDENEREMRFAGRYAKMKDVANKSAEQAARIAGILALVDSPHVETISDEVMKRAIVLAQWYLEEARRLIESAVADEIGDGQSLLDWIISLPIGEGEPGWRVSKRKMQQFGPGRLRKDNKRREAAIDSLCSEQLAARPGAGKDGSVYVARVTCSRL